MSKIELTHAEKVMDLRQLLSLSERVVEAGVFLYVPRSVYHSALRVGLAHAELTKEAIAQRDYATTQWQSFRELASMIQRTADKLRAELDAMKASRLLYQEEFAKVKRERDDLAEQVESFEFRTLTPFDEAIQDICGYHDDQDVIDHDSTQLELMLHLAHCGVVTYAAALAEDRQCEEPADIDEGEQEDSQAEAS